MDAPNLALPVEQPPVLVIRDLRVEFPHHAGKAVVIDGIDLTVDRGKTVCIVGESGCGKSMLALSTMGLVPPPGRVAGTIMVDRTNIVGLPPTKMRRIRGRRIAMIFQEPMTSLNPVLSIGYQIMEALKEHDPGASAGTRKARAIEALVQVRMPAAERRFHEYPHQLSGGMRQRAMIAMALACRPDVLIADEPTTALDVTIQAQILELLRDLQRETEMAIILVTHDLGVVAEMADDVAVMYAGRVVEYAPCRTLFGDPRHPYTIALLASIPSMHEEQGSLLSIEGMVPNAFAMPNGCRFHPRCVFATEQCPDVSPDLRTLSPAHRVACIHPPLAK